MQVPEEIRKSVFFILHQDENNSRLLGTGFFVSILDENDPSRQFVYLVTAKHVIVEVGKLDPDRRIWLRINTNDGSQVIETIADNWKFHPDDFSVDAAVLAWAPDADQFDYKTLAIELAVTKTVIDRELIGIGDQIFLTGLFVNHAGKSKNIPIVRTGNIAAMPEEPVAVKNFDPIEAYLVEARSIGGLSGSPVFVYLSEMRVFGEQTQVRGRKFYWLGLMHGHWNLPAPQQDTVVEDFISKEAVNMGIGIVVPATKILEIIDQPLFQQARKRESQTE